MELDEVAAPVIEDRADAGRILGRLALERHAGGKQPFILGLHIRNAERDGCQAGIVQGVHVVRGDGVVAGFQQEAHGTVVRTGILDDEEVVLGHGHQGLEAQGLCVEDVGGRWVLDVDAAHFQSHGA